MHTNNFLAGLHHPSDLPVHCSLVALDANCQPVLWMTCKSFAGDTWTPHDDHNAHKNYATADAEQKEKEKIGSKLNGNRFFHVEHCSVQLLRGLFVCDEQEEDWVKTLAVCLQLDPLSVCLLFEVVGTIFAISLDFPSLKIQRLSAIISLWLHPPPPQKKIWRCKDHKSSRWIVSSLNFDTAFVQNNCPQLNYFVPLPTPSCCFQIKNNIKDTSPINVEILISSWLDKRRGGATLVTLVTSFGLPAWPSTTGAAAAAGMAGHFRRLWLKWPQTPQLRCLATGLSIDAAGLFGDDMVEEKMNVVVVSAMSQINYHPSNVTALSCLLQRPPL
jgi:hypothetical protein